MDLAPWELLGVTGLPLLGLLAAVYLVKRIVDGSIDRLQQGWAEERERERESRLAWAQIDVDLRNKRADPYLELWKLGDGLPLWPRNTELTYAHLVDLMNGLRSWYFGGGGMYLSQASRAKYSDVQNAIGLVVTRGNDRAAPVTDADYDTIRNAFSTLRTELTDDLQSRARGPARPVA